MNLHLNEEQQKLFDEHYGYTTYLAKKDKYNTFVNINDKRQEAIIVLCRCSKKWNKHKGVKFITYLTCAVHNKLKQLYKYSAYKQTEKFSDSMYDDEHWEENEDIWHIDNAEVANLILDLFNNNKFNEFDKEMIYCTFGLKGRPVLSFRKFVQTHPHPTMSYVKLCGMDYYGTVLTQWRHLINEEKITN